MDQPVSTRIPKDVLMGIKQIAREEHVDTSVIIRRFLLKALAERKIERILKQLEEHKISIGQASEDSGLTLWEIMDLAKEKGIDWIGMGEEEIADQMKYV